jgi:hypothetical protein
MNSLLYPRLSAFIRGFFFWLRPKAGLRLSAVVSVCVFSGHPKITKPLGIQHFLRICRSVTVGKIKPFTMILDGAGPATRITRGVNDTPGM